MNVMNKVFMAAVAAGMALYAADAYAFTADEIIVKANEASYYQAGDGRAAAHMKIVDAQGREREREFTILRRDTDAAGQRYYVYFRKPEDVRDMVYMVWKNPQGDDDRWLYLPALDLVRRIASTDKRTSFVGSHFVYEDVSGRNVSADTHTLTEETDTYYLLDNVPVDSSQVEFARYTVKIDKKTFLPLEAKYYDASGTLIREMLASDIKDIGGYPTAMKMTANDYLRGGHTELTYTGVEYDIGIEEDVFTERYLKRAPRKYLKTE